MQKSFLIFGNSAVDASLDVPYRTEQDAFILEDGESSLEIKVQDGPIQTQFKHTIDGNTREVLEDLGAETHAGGGGINSAKAISRIFGEMRPRSVLYFDTGHENPVIVESLNRHDIPFVYFSINEPPTNLVIGKRSNKTIVKGNYKGQRPLPNEEFSLIEAMIHEDTVVFLNSLKDNSLTRRLLDVLEERGKGYFVVTPSVDPDLALLDLVSKGVTFFNYDDLMTIMEIDDRKTNEKQKMAVSLEFLGSIKRHGLSEGNPVYVTLGKNGTYCFDGEQIYYIHLDQKASDKVQESLKRNPSNIVGAGDVFAGVIAYSSSLVDNPDYVDLAKVGSAAAIAHIGYPKHLPDSSFVMENLE